MEEKDKTWKLLRTLKHQNDKAWLCAGDFNEILYSWEKEGGQPRAQSCMDKFKMALEDCELSDLGFKGDVFTWRNHNHDANKYIHERLDRAVASHTWRQHFPAVTIVNGDPRHLDHRPVIIDTQGAQAKGQYSGNNMMPRFEARWTEEEECREKIKETWEKELEENRQNASGALKGVMTKLCSWNRNILGDLEKRISRLKKELESWRKKDIGPEQTRKEEMLRFKLSRLEDQLDL